MAINIREATLTDIQSVIQLGWLMHDEAPNYARMTFAPDKVEKIVSALVQAENGLVLVAEDGDKVIGGVVAEVCEHWGHTELMAFEYVVYVKPEYRHCMLGVNLIRQYFKWARDRGVKPGFTSIGLSTGIQTDRLKELYQKLGCQLVTFVFEV